MKTTLYINLWSGPEGQWPKIQPDTLKNVDWVNSLRADNRVRMYYDPYKQLNSLRYLIIIDY